MDIERSLGIVGPLADGRDPLTGELLGAGHLCQQPDVIRALPAAREIMAREARRERRLRQARLTLPANTGRSWSGDEDQLLISRFRTGSSLTDMATLHARTPGAITARLEKLSLIDKTGRARLVTRNPGARLTPPAGSYDHPRDRGDTAGSRPAPLGPQGPDG